MGKYDMNKIISGVHDAIGSCLDDPVVTAWSRIESVRDDAGYYHGQFAIVAGYMDGFDKNESDRYGRDGERLCVKLAFLPEHSMMSEYQMDWVMPSYPGTDEIMDTEIALYEGTNIYQIVADLMEEYQNFQLLKLVYEINECKDKDIRESLCDKFIDMVHDRCKDMELQEYDNATLYETYINFDSNCGATLVKVSVELDDLLKNTDNMDYASTADAWQDIYNNMDGSIRNEEWYDLITEDFYIKNVDMVNELCRDVIDHKTVEELEEKEFLSDVADYVKEQEIEK